MSGNELVLLEQVLRQRQQDRPKPLPDDVAFEIFACEQSLFDRDLSNEEIEAGVIGGSNDGAIDGVYVFLADELLSDDSEYLEDGFKPSGIPDRSSLAIWLIQAKTEKSFKETVFDKVAASTKRLLSLSEDEAELSKLYSQDVIARTGLFRNALRKFAARHLQVSVHFVYVTLGDTKERNTKVDVRAQHLEDQFREVMTSAVGVVEFLGVSELWARANTIPSYTSELTYLENATTGDSHVALVKLGDYVSFLQDERGNLKRHFFDLNVRDYQGDVEVNREIRASLEDPDSPDFWWLNNGVTIVCSSAHIVGRKYIIDDVQIVNGLQTSQSIFRVLQGALPDHPAFQRAVLLRILPTADAITRDKVIRATNKQTSVPPASLRATESIQRDIELYFVDRDWYYDRRKNYYRNIGKSAERIVSIPYLAQAVMAMGMSRPDNSRARPSSLLKRNDEYGKIFSDKIDLQTFLWLAQSQRAVDAFLTSGEAQATTQEKSNLRFHLAMLAARKLAKTQVHSPAQLNKLAATQVELTEAGLPELLTGLRQSFADYALQTSSSPDRISKSQDFVKSLLSE